MRPSAGQKCIQLSRNMPPTSTRCRKLTASTASGSLTDLPIELLSPPRFPLPFLSFRFYPLTFLTFPLLTRPYGVSLCFLASTILPLITSLYRLTFLRQSFGLQTAGQADRRRYTHTQTRLTEKSQNVNKKM